MDAERRSVFARGNEANLFGAARTPVPIEVSRRQRRCAPIAPPPPQLRLTRVGGKATAGVMRDVVMLAGFQDLEVDFIADNPGSTLFHFHQQVHRDFGFMALFKYA